jgi:hypothetical protein
MDRLTDMELLRAAERYKLALTIALGVLIPLRSLTLSKIAGTLASGGFYALAAFGWPWLIGCRSLREWASTSALSHPTSTDRCGGRQLFYCIRHTSWPNSDSVGKRPQRR